MSFSSNLNRPRIFSALQKFLKFANIKNSPRVKISMFSLVNVIIYQINKKIKK